MVIITAVAKCKKSQKRVSLNHVCVMNVCVWSGQPAQADRLTKTWKHFQHMHVVKAHSHFIEHKNQICEEFVYWHTSVTLK